MYFVFDAYVLDPNKRTFVPMTASLPPPSLSKSSFRSNPTLHPNQYHHRLWICQFSRNNGGWKTKGAVQWKMCCRVTCKLTCQGEKELFPQRGTWVFFYSWCFSGRPGLGYEAQAGSVFSGTGHFSRAAHLNMKKQKSSYNQAPEQEGQ